jgi:hypothetical protein
MQDALALTWRLVLARKDTAAVASLALCQLLSDLQ